MGSGETSPTMVSVHRRLVDLIGRPDPRAVLVDTPYGFQQNAAEISAKARSYFLTSVGLRVTVPAGLHGGGDDDTDRALAALTAADWIFSGPGSPTYALACWRANRAAHVLRDRFTRPHGVVVFASAAAATMGRFTVPVYEIYKVGAAPHWLDGLDLFGHLDLPVAVIPHYDNTEGGTHDTRYAYLGEPRLRVLEQQLPADAAVLGVDEHTAVLLDLGAAEVEVVGRGGMTVRRDGRSQVFPAGATLTLTDLRDLVHGRSRIPRPRTTGQTPRAPAQPAPATLTETAARCTARFDDGLRRGDAEAMVSAVLDLETAVHTWAADTEEDDGTTQARTVLRTLVVRLGQAATTGLQNPDERLRPLVEPLVALRERLRQRNDYGAADGIRESLAVGGVQLDDTPDGPRWALRAVPIE
ncbi:hypothetical protein ACN28C_33560 [Plantactinospora sp. WMMC1484]|uniref:hypothetical protein n=1 Tax=Plantactinospora sp. WMMC1484 TaxID=3404122 RepID=UPI003BF46293